MILLSIKWVFIACNIVLIFPMCLTLIISNLDMSASSFESNAQRTHQSILHGGYRSGNSSYAEINCRLNHATSSVDDAIGARSPVFIEVDEIGIPPHPDWIVDETGQALIRADIEFSDGTIQSYNGTVLYRLNEGALQVVSDGFSSRFEMLSVDRAEFTDLFGNMTTIRCFQTQAL